MEVAAASCCPSRISRARARSLGNESVELLTQRAARPGEPHQRVGLGDRGLCGCRRRDVELPLDLCKQRLEGVAPVGGSGRHWWRQRARRCHWRQRERGRILGRPDRCLGLADVHAWQAGSEPRLGPKHGCLARCRVDEARLLCGRWRRRCDALGSSNARTGSRGAANDSRALPFA